MLHFALVASALAGDMTVNNKAAHDIMLCARSDPFSTPGNQAKVAVAAGKTVSVAEVSSAKGPGILFSLLNMTTCPYDDCNNTVNHTSTSCLHYPYFAGRGVSDANSSAWYGSIGKNWDGQDFTEPGNPAQGFTGDWSKVGYSIKLECTAYGTKAISITASPTGVTGTCSGADGACPPNGGQANSGTVLCDTGSAITWTIS